MKTITLHRGFSLLREVEPLTIVIDEELPSLLTGVDTLLLTEQEGKELVAALKRTLPAFTFDVVLLLMLEDRIKEYRPSRGTVSGEEERKGEFD